MTKRRRVSTKDRVALFQREGGRCHYCGGLVYPGQAWELSHKTPLALGGADDASNWGVIHKRPCHEELTRTIDVPAIAKAKRREARHLGVRKTPTLKGGNTLPSAAPARRATTPPTKIALGPPAWARRIVEQERT